MPTEVKSPFACLSHYHTRNFGGTHKLGAKLMSPLNFRQSTQETEGGLKNGLLKRFICIGFKHITIKSRVEMQNKVTILSQQKSRNFPNFISLLKSITPYSQNGIWMSTKGEPEAFLIDQLG